MNVAKTIFLNVGHDLYKDRGVIHNGIIENEEAMKIRDLLKPLLEKHFKVYCVPDQFGLQESVKWVNGGAQKLNDGLALSLHLNSNGGKGAECFYYDWSLKGKGMAKKLIDKYCEITGFRNRGAKPDRKSRVKSLWWIKKTNPWALLLEMCFIDNSGDMKIFSDHQKIAQAIYEGICAIYKIPVTSNRIEIKNKIVWHFGQGVKLLEQL